MYWQTKFSYRRYHENSTPPSFFSGFNVQTPFSFLPCFHITTWFNHFPFLSGFWKSKQHDAHILGLSLHLKNAWESNEMKMKTKLTFWRQQSMTALQASCSFSLTEYDSDINWSISSSVIFDQIVVQARMRNWSFSWRGCLKTSGQADPLKSENVTWKSFQKWKRNTWIEFEIRKSKRNNIHIICCHDNFAILKQDSLWITAIHEKNVWFVDECCHNGWFAQVKNLILHAIWIAPVIPKILQLFLFKLRKTEFVYILNPSSMATVMDSSLTSSVEESKYVLNSSLSLIVLNKCSFKNKDVLSPPEPSYIAPHVKSGSPLKPSEHWNVLNCPSVLTDPNFSSEFFDIFQEANIFN